MRRLPTWLPVVYGLWMAAWVPVYWIHNGPQNFLWLCDVANFLIFVGIVLESRLIISSQAVGVLLVQLLWVLDAATRALAGFHPIGGTEYMFDASRPLVPRLFSLFHAVVPPLLIWLLLRLGYDRRGVKLQSAIVWVLLPATYLLTDPERNINWLWEPFGIRQTLVPDPAFLLLAMAAYPLLLFLPTHALLARFVPSPEEP